MDSEISNIAEQEGAPKIPPKTFGDLEALAKEKNTVFKMPDGYENLPEEDLQNLINEKYEEINSLGVQDPVENLKRFNASLNDGGNGNETISSAEEINIGGKMEIPSEMQIKATSAPEFDHIKYMQNEMARQKLEKEGTQPVPAPEPPAQPEVIPKPATETAPETASQESQIAQPEIPPGQKEVQDIFKRLEEADKLKEQQPNLQAASQTPQSKPIPKSEVLSSPALQEQKMQSVPESISVVQEGVSVGAGSELSPGQKEVQDIFQRLDEADAKKEAEATANSQPEPIPAPEVPPPSVSEPQPEPVPAPKELKEETAPGEQLQTVEKPVDELEELKKVRNELAKAEASRNGKKPDLAAEIELSKLRMKYAEAREKVAATVKRLANESAGVGEGQTPTEEQQRKINDFIFEQMVVEEHRSYLSAINANREETWKDKTKIEMAKILGSKAMQGYLKLPRWKRIAITTALGTGIGIAAGAAGALGVAGYAAFRVSRAAASFGGSTLGTMIGEKKKSWSIETLNQNENGEIRELKESNKSLEEKAKGYAEIKERYEKERKKVTLKKAALTVGLGAGAGLLSGLSEHVFAGVGKSADALQAGGSKTGAAEQLQNAKPKLTETETPSAKVEAQNLAPKTETLESAQNSTSAAPAPTTDRLQDAGMKAKIEHQPIAPNETLAREPDTEVINQYMKASEEAAATKQLFSDPSVFHHEAISGDSTWKILEKTLDHDPRFQGMGEAQKTFVLSALTNKALQDPGAYGLGKDGLLHIGDKTDFTKLFENTKDFNSIIDKAQHLSAGQIKSITENNAKILEWVKAHPHEPLNEGKVAEILGEKPKVEVIQEPEFKTPNQLEEEALIKAGLEPENQVISEPEIKTPNQLEAEALTKAGLSESETPTVTEGSYNTPGATSPEPDGFGDYLRAIGQDYDTVMKRQGGMTIEEIQKSQVPIEPVPSPMTQPPGLHHDVNEVHQIHNEIADAKQRLAELEGKVKNPNLERSLVADSKAYMSDVEFNKSIEGAFKSEIDNIYGSKGVLGFGRTAGVNSKEWAEMARLPANKVVEYYTGDSTKSGLSAAIVDKLAKSKNHNTLMRQAVGLMEQTNGAVKPFENENMEQFIKRLGGYLMTHVPSTQKVA